MRRLWVVLAVLAVAAVVGLYLAGGGPRERASAARPTAEAPAAKPEAPAPEAPSDPAPAVVRVAVKDPEKNPVAGAVVGVLKDAEIEGKTATTGADGRCELPVPRAGWFVLAVRHPAFVPARAYVQAGGPEREVLLERGPPFTVVVADPTGKLLEGADVAVLSERTHGASGIWRWSQVEDLGRFRTDAEGRAKVGAVPLATIVVKVDRAPFALHESRVDVTGDLPVEHLVRLDGGGILVGRVVGPKGEGVPGATVKCKNLSRPAATSGPDGTFRLEGVAPGSVELLADAEGYGPGFFGAALGWGEPVPIPIRSGETLAGLEILLAKPVHVTGRILADDGKPVEGVTVQTFMRNGFGMNTQVTSDAEGRFKAGPFGMREAGQVWAWFSSTGHRIEQASAPVPPDKDVDLGDIKATRQATVRGVLVDEAGMAVEAQVNVTTAQGFGGSYSTPSKPDGTFELAGVGPGPVTLVAQRNEAPVLRSRPLALETASGQEIDGVELVLLPTKSIAGRVITPDGKPRPRAIVGIREAAGKNIDTAWADAEGKFVFADLAEGEYEVGILGRGSLWFGQEKNFLEDPPPVKALAGRDDLEFVFPMKGGIITGKVVAKRDGGAVKEFDATFLRYTLFIPSDTDLEGFEDPEGVFRYETDEPGTWQVDVSAVGYASHRTERFSLAAGEVKDVGTIKLGPGGTIAGRVLDAQQQPVPYARINILNEKLQTNDDEPYTDLDGRFEVPGVSPGPFTVFAVSPRHPLGMVRNINVREGERTDVQIVFVEPAPLTIDVRDPNGQPVEGASLDFTFPAVAPLTSKLFRNKIPPGYGSHVSDAGGTIFQPCLPPGEVTITIEAGGFENATRKLDLKPGEPNRVEIRLRRSGG